MTEIKNGGETKTAFVRLAKSMFWTFEFKSFVLVSDLEIRISNLGRGGRDCVSGFPVLNFGHLNI
jgi:hypothetical protein